MEINSCNLPALIYRREYSSSLSFFFHYLRNSSFLFALETYGIFSNNINHCIFFNYSHTHSSMISGISVGGIGPNKKAFSGASLPFVDHLPHTHSLKDMAFSKGLPEWGSHLADELERIISLHDASTIAAVIVEPVAGMNYILF